MLNLRSGIPTQATLHDNLVHMGLMPSTWHVLPAFVINHTSRLILLRLENLHLAVAFRTRQAGRGRYDNELTSRELHQSGSELQYAK